ncbi:hypothetical protein D9M70_332440 [compost metagenome]
MRGEAADVENLLAGLRVGTDHGMLDFRILPGEACALFRRHHGTERMLDAALCTQAVDAPFDVIGKPPVRLDHIDPDRVPALLRALDTPKHGPHRGRRAPEPIGMVVVLVGPFLVRVVDLHQPGVVGMTASYRMGLQVAKPGRERHVLCARDVLVPEEQDAMLQEQRLDLGKQRVVSRRLAKMHPRYHRTNAAGQLLNPDHERLHFARQ